MKKKLFPLLAFFACVIFLLLAVGLIYAKFKSSRAQEARAAAALQNSQGDGNALTEALTGQVSSVPLSAHMPPPIGSENRAASEERATLDRMSSGPHLTNPVKKLPPPPKADSQ